MPGSPRRPLRPGAPVAPLAPVAPVSPGGPGRPVQHDNVQNDLSHSHTLDNTIFTTKQNVFWQYGLIIFCDQITASLPVSASATDNTHWLLA